LEFDDLKLLNEAQKDLYMRFQRLFESDYWPLVVQHAQIKVNESVMRQLGATNWETVVESRGQSTAWSQVVSLQQEYDHLFDQMVEEAKMTKEIEDYE